MKKQDVIMEVLTTCSKAREKMLKEGPPDPEAYMQLQRFEELALTDMSQPPKTNGKGVGALIPGTGNGMIPGTEKGFIPGTEKGFIPGTERGTPGGLEDVGRG